MRGAPPPAPEKRRANLSQGQFELIRADGAVARSVPQRALRVPRRAVIDLQGTHRRAVVSSANRVNADRDLFQAELDLSQIRLQELLTVVQLYKALGGGWR